MEIDDKINHYKDRALTVWQTSPSCVLGQRQVPKMLSMQEPPFRHGLGEQRFTCSHIVPVYLGSQRQEKLSAVATQTLLLRQGLVLQGSAGGIEQVYSLPYAFVSQFPAEQETSSPAALRHEEEGSVYM